MHRLAKRPHRPGASARRRALKIVSVPVTWTDIRRALPAQASWQRTLERADALDAAEELAQAENEARREWAREREQAPASSSACEQACGRSRGHYSHHSHHEGEKLKRGEHVRSGSLAGVVTPGPESRRRRQQQRGGYTAAEVLELTRQRRANKRPAERTIPALLWSHIGVLGRPVRQPR